MTDYISREAAKKIVDNINTFCAGWRYVAIDEIDALPAADVREVKKGKWELVHCDDGYGGYDLYTHKECGAISVQKRNYCHNCGADMRRGQT